MGKREWETFHIHYKHGGDVKKIFPWPCVSKNVEHTDSSSSLCICRLQYGGKGTEHTLTGRSKSSFSPVVDIWPTSQMKTLVSFVSIVHLEESRTHVVLLARGGQQDMCWNLLIGRLGEVCTNDFPSSCPSHSTVWALMDILGSWGPTFEQDQCGMGVRRERLMWRDWTPHWTLKLH